MQKVLFEGLFNVLIIGKLVFVKLIHGSRWLFKVVSSFLSGLIRGLLLLLLLENCVLNL